MADDVGVEIKVPQTPEEQARTSIREMAQNILTIADQIAQEKRLSTEPKGNNFAWTIHAHTRSSVSEPMPSYSAQVLHEATTGNMLNARNAMGVNFKGIDMELGLYEYGDSETAPHYLTVDFMKRLGFMGSDETIGPDTQTDREKNAVVFTHPTKPFIAECSIRGPLPTGGPRVSSFVLRYKPLS